LRDVQDGGKVTTIDLPVLNGFFLFTTGIKVNNKIHTKLYISFAVVE
jgi:hypothetical protein